MANGKGFAQCHYCPEFIVTNSERCKKHNIDLSKIKIGYETLCKDYKFDKDFPERVCKEISDFKDGYLYYYCVQGRRHFSSLDRFENLKCPIYGICVLDDKEYGWLFEINRFDTYGFKEKNKITFRYKNISANFIQKKLTKQMLQGTFPLIGTTFKEREINAFVPEQGGKELLDRFVDDFVGLDTYLNKKANKENAFYFGIGLSIFLKEIDTGIYELLENEHNKNFLLNLK